MDSPYRIPGQLGPPLDPAPSPEPKRDANGIQIIELRDLLGEDLNVDGATVVPLKERAIGKRTADGKWKNNGHQGLGRIKFWVILDLGAKGQRTRRDRYIAVGVGDWQDIADVELEESGIAIPGEYIDYEAASSVCSDLCAVSRIHEI